MSNGTQYTSEQELRIFWSTHGIYNMARLEFLDCLIADVAMHTYTKKKAAKRELKWKHEIKET